MGLCTHKVTLLKHQIREMTVRRKDFDLPPASSLKLFRESVGLSVDVDGIIRDQPIEPATVHEPPLPAGTSRGCAGTSNSSCYTVQGAFSPSSCRYNSRCPSYVPLKTIHTSVLPIQCLK